MTEEAEDWRWVDVDGAQKPIDEWELVSSLSTGALPAYTLVWRKGWATWIPACRVEELASAVPADKRETSVEPQADPGRDEPPPPPLEEYDRYRTRQAASQLVGARRMPRSATVPPPPPGTSGPGRGATAAASLVGKAASGATPPPPPPPPVRRPMPTLIEQPDAPSSMTLRPPGAVPPPPRGVPTTRPRISSNPTEPRRATGVIDTPVPDIAFQPAHPEHEEAEAPEAAPAEAASPDAASTEADKPTPGETAPAQPAAPPVDLAKTQESASPGPGAPAEPAVEPPTLPHASPGPLAAPGQSEALPSWSAELELASAPGASAGPVAPAPVAAPAAGAPAGAPAPSPGPTRFPVAVVALGGLALALGVLVVVLLATRHNKLNPLRTADSAVSPAATTSAAPVQQCKLVRPAHRLARSILRSIPPYVTSTPDGSRVAIGVAASRTTALGLLVDPVTLSVARAFARNGREPLLGVVPTTASGKLRFAVTRTDAPLGYARMVDGKPRFMLGMSDSGFARVVGAGKPEVLWPGGTGERMTEIRIATLPSGDHAVAFRRGGQSGQVLVGWLGPHGSRKSALSPVQGDQFLGTPMVAANKSSILVVFASRDSRQDHWGVRLAHAPHGKLPASSQRFKIPPGGPGVEAISPAAAGLGDERWLLQWTEGSSGEHAVRVQMLGADLQPIGDAITVSPKEANAGQGVVWVRGGKALSLFLVSTGRRLELWGAALKCP